MKMNARVTVTALVIALTAGAVVAHGDNYANDEPHGDGFGGHDMMQMMMRGHGMTTAGDGHSAMGMMGGNGTMMNGHMPMTGAMYGGLAKKLDEDGDGSVTPEEISKGLDELLKEYDADGNGMLSIGEFETLHSALIRETMVDRFQYLDADGDGQITEEEMQAPAEMMERMRSSRDWMPNGQRHVPGQMMQDTDDMRPGQGHMMDNNGSRMPNRQGN